MEQKELAELKVAVLAGGWSDEREVSLESGKACVRALQQAGIKNTVLLDVAQHDFIKKISDNRPDVAFPALHGRFGEDGCIQGLLEILHIPYTFSNVKASAVASDKAMAKQLFSSVGIPVAKSITLNPCDVAEGEKAARIVKELGLPLFVKPTNNGSSYGISRVEQVAELAPAVKAARQSKGSILIEQAIDGTEITVPVIGNEHTHALPVVEIVTGAAFYDSQVKYEPSALHHIIPARLDPGIYAKAQEYAQRAHRVLGCSGASRSDFIVTSDGTPVILETNTIPGMTEASLLPDSARHGGIEFSELCLRFVKYALKNNDIELV